MQKIHLPHRAPPRRLRASALLAAVLLHVGAVLFIPVPVVRPGAEVVTLLVPTDVEEMPPPIVAPAASELVAAAGEAVATAGSNIVAPGPSGEIPPPALAVAIPFLPDRGGAPESPVPSAALTEARAATLPLVVGPGGGLGARRLGRTPEQLAIARAESLLVARLAGIAVVERRDTGAVGLANGGVTIAIPWPGFLPANRSDEKWREERCSGSGDGDSDKAGEGEARGAQCD